MFECETGELAIILLLCVCSQQPPTPTPICNAVALGFICNVAKKTAGIKSAGGWEHHLC